MHSSHMSWERPTSRSGYGWDSSSACAGESDSAHGEPRDSPARSACSAASAARIAARSASSGSGLISGDSTGWRLMRRVSAVDDVLVGQRLAMLAAAVAVAAVAAGSAPGAASRIPDWAAPQIATVVAHGLMGAKSVRRFRPNAALTRQTVADLAVGLQEELASPSSPSSDSGFTTTTGSTSTGTTATNTTTTAPPVSNPTATVTMAELDR